jgi:protoporphyrinogen oxidase
LLKFKAFDLKDKFSLKNISKIVNDPGKLEGEFENAGLLLKSLKQTENLFKYFWEPFILAVFNTVPGKVSADIFLNVMKTGFSAKNSSTLVIPEVNLNELLIDDAVSYFQNKETELRLNSRVDRIISDEKEKKIEWLIMEDGEKIVSDYYISAVPFFAFKKMFEKSIYQKNNFKEEFLKTSSIVSVHLFLENEITDEILPVNSLGMTGLIGTIVQWLFIRNKKHLSLVISGADDLQITEKSQDEILEICLNDLKKTIITNYKLQITNYRLQITNYKLQITNYRLQITDYKLQITNYRLQITDYKLQITNYKLQVTSYDSTPDTQRTRKLIFINKKLNKAWKLKQSHQKQFRY